MSDLLETKLSIPRARPEVVPRPRLAQLLDRAARSRLTLISAPPGFGKTTILADWLGQGATDGRAVAWLSLDPSDDDEAAFARYLVSALDGAVPADGRHRSPERSSSLGQPALTSLLNALRDVTHQVVLVLDDYHVIGRPEIHDGLAYLLDHLPANVRLVIATRSDPPLPLARLRARGDLVEIRAADLRFTAEETSTYLNDSMGLALAAGDVAALGERTEGWIAALQLAALSMSGRTDRPAFIADFAGDDRYVVDYLVEEVLDQQPARIREFLLRTSILDRMTGTLCDAVTRGDDGRVLLERLDRANLFVVPLDDRRRWYRYHHLFADVLRARLLDEAADEVPEAHRRASAWFEAHGEPAEAIRHALAAGDTDRAADLIELAAHDLRASRRERTLRRWLDALPDQVFERRPVLAIAHVGALLATGETTRVEDRLAAAERWEGAGLGDAAAADGPIVRHPHAFGHLRSAIALYRAALARMRGDPAGTIEYASAALAAAGSDQPLERGGAAGILALARWSVGDLDGAFDAWTDSTASLEEAGHRADMLGASLAMADIRSAQGRLADARRILERGRAIGTAVDPPLRGTADMLVGLAEIARERNDLAAARRHLDEAASLGDAFGLPQHPHRLRVAQAGMAMADEDAATAVGLLDEADARYDGDFFPDVRPIAALRARAWIRHGRLADARAWAEESALVEDEDVAYDREFAHATLVRLLVAEGRRDGAPERFAEAARSGERLLTAALDGGRRGSAIDILVGLALAHHGRGDETMATAALDRALALAAPDGWMRTFLDEGPPMAALLAVVGEADRRPSYLIDVRAAARPTDGEDRGASRSGLIEPLSERERQVLRLLRSDLDGPAMARELHVSVNTLRTHTKHLYGKLGVSGRRAAVRRAEELGLLSQRDADPA